MLIIVMMYQKWRKSIVDLAIHLPFPLCLDCWAHLRCIGVVRELVTLDTLDGLASVFTVCSALSCHLAVLPSPFDPQSSRAPSVEDDEEGHLIYHTGDMLQDRCS